MKKNFIHNFHSDDWEELELIQDIKNCLQSDNDAHMSFYRDALFYHCKASLYSKTPSKTVIYINLYFNKGIY